MRGAGIGPRDAWATDGAVSALERLEDDTIVRRAPRLAWECVQGSGETSACRSYAALRRPYPVMMHGARPSDQTVGLQRVSSCEVWARYDTTLMVEGDCT